MRNKYNLSRIYALNSVLVRTLTKFVENLKVWRHSTWGSCLKMKLPAVKGLLWGICWLAWRQQWTSGPIADSKFLNVSATFSSSRKILLSEVCCISIYTTIFSERLKLRHIIYDYMTSQPFRSILILLLLLLLLLLLILLLLLLLLLLLCFIINIARETDLI